MEAIITFIYNILTEISCLLQFLCKRRMSLMKGWLEDFNNYTRCIREYFYKDKTEVDKGYYCLHILNPLSHLCFYLKKKKNFYPII